MNRIYLSTILSLCGSVANSQGYFTDLPRDLQLYPRNASNQAEVIISGVTDRGYSKISVQTLREGVLTTTVSQTATDTNTGFPFRLSSVIKAERAEYSFRVFLHKNNDSTLIAERKRIVSGDVYLIHGQSNAIPTGGLDEYYSFNFDDKYLRNCDYTGDPSSIQWYAAKRPFGSIGEFGLTIQQYILQKHGIPTLFLNGADGGKDISILTQRDPVDPTNVATRYGKLLYRARWAGVDKHIKALFWKQGEADAGNGVAGYEQKFDQFYRNLQTDYGKDIHVYVSQINIIDNPPPNSKVDIAPQIRDFQRRAQYLYPKTKSIATVGTSGYDGVHYNTLGHQQLAFEQFRQVSRDMYGSIDTVQIDSPDIKMLFYNARKDSITLVFDEQMQMVWKADSATYDFSNGKLTKIRYLKDFFYLDGQSKLVTGGYASKNRIVLSLKQPSTARLMRYLPSYFSDFPSSSAYDGPTLQNTRGMRAFSFDNVPIADAIPATSITARAISDKLVQLNWIASAGATTQLLERAVGTPTNFVQIAALSGIAATFNDTDLPDLFGTYYYRLKSVSATSESKYGNVAVASPLVLGVEPENDIVKIFPNPVVTGGSMQVDAGPLLIKELILRDSYGRAVNVWQGVPQLNLQIYIPNLSAGLYIADLRTVTGQLLRRKLVVQ